MIEYATNLNNSTIPLHIGRRSPGHKYIQKGFKGERMVVVPREIIKKYKDQDLVNTLYLTDIGFFPKAIHHYRHRPVGCEEYILIYCLEGTGLVKTTSTKFNLSPNTFCILEQGQQHEYVSDSNDPWSIYWVHFSGTKASYLYKKFILQNFGNPVFIPFNRNKIKEFDYAIDLFKHGYADQVFEYSSMLLHKILGSFIYSSLKSNNNQGREKEDLVLRLTKFLSENIHLTLTTDEIAREFNRSASTLFNVFKEKKGYSIMQFYRLLKIQKACELINLTNLSIKEISYKLGYQDPLYFSRVFRKNMGISPRDYKKSFN